MSLNKKLRYIFFTKWCPSDTRHIVISVQRVTLGDEIG